ARRRAVVRGAAGARHARGDVSTHARGAVAVQAGPRAYPPHPARGRPGASGHLGRAGGARRRPRVHRRDRQRRGSFGGGEPRGVLPDPRRIHDDGHAPVVATGSAPADRTRPAARHRCEGLFIGCGPISRPGRSCGPERGEQGQGERSQDRGIPRGGTTRSPLTARRQPPPQACVNSRAACGAAHGWRDAGHFSPTSWIVAPAATRLMPSSMSLAYSMERFTTRLPLVMRICSLVLRKDMAAAPGAACALRLTLLPEMITDSVRRVWSGVLPSAKLMQEPWMSTNTLPAHTTRSAPSTPIAPICGRMPMKVLPVITVSMAFSLVP